MPNEARNNTTGNFAVSDDAAVDSSTQKCTAQDAEAKPGKRVKKKDAGKTGKTTKRHASKEQRDKLNKAQAKAKEKQPKTVKERLLALVTDTPFAVKVMGAVVVLLVVTVAMLYPMGCTYYQALREEQRYQAELDAVNARNDAIQQENDDLGTDEGVENQARKELGWVKDGEQAVIISNSSGELSSGMPDQVDSDSIEAPHTWYYDILDVVFQAKTRQS